MSDPYQMSPSVAEVARQVTGNPKWAAPADPMPLSDAASETFTSIVGRIKELEACDRLLGEVLATLCIERNRQQMLENPGEALPLFFQVADRWSARRKALAKE